MNEGVWDFTMSIAQMTRFQEVYYSNSEPRLCSFYAHDPILQAPLCQFVSPLMIKGARSNFATSSVIVSYGL
jgi:hypothetical protein